MRRAKKIGIVCVGILMVVFMFLSYSNLFGGETKRDITKISVIGIKRKNSQVEDFKRGIEEAANAKRVDVEYLEIEEDYDTIKEYIDREIKNGSQALIVFSEKEEQILSYLQSEKKKIPLILVNPGGTEEKTIRVWFDVQDMAECLAEKIHQADAVLIGGGSGLSSAAGYNHYHWLPYMEKCLQDFKEWYGLKSPFDGFYYCYSSPEQQWAYYARYIQSMWDAPTGQPYYDLRDIVAEKEVFVLTTNIDMQFERIFQKERICDYQGNSGYFQCSQPCHDQIYSNVEMIRRMNENIRELRVTSELLPRCNECGRIMVPWVRDDTFLEGKDWREGVRRYENFLKKYLMNGTDKNVVLLELGVGEMTPSIIKLPFWEMTYKNEKVFYACLNQKKSSAPEHIKDKGIYIAGDLAETLRDLKENIVGKEM